ncbi:MAG TPA: 23S rRNA (guanosine(2251)-2'-O)-methyltransferase RlmB [Syntrophomonadaceae bacterium]|nr:23S rRNA (guanosine(2251)-2'-O)-methyltransferase RlmB [Syntrophomonadaceae bacterium]
MTDKLAGINPIIEALRGRRKIHKIYIQAGKQGKRLQELLGLARKKGVFIQEVEKERLNQLYKIGNHQGIVATVESFSYSSVEEMLEKAALAGEEPLVLILDGIEDPQNMGSIIRTAECAGVHGVIIPRHNTAEVNDTVARVAAGALEHVLVAQETNLVQVIQRLKDAGFWVVGSDMQADLPYYTTQFPAPTALVIGGEGQGVRRLVLENCDMVVKIPMYGQIGSLNASVAAALLIYEALRQRSTVPKG